MTKVMTAEYLSSARANRERIANDYTAGWHIQQDLMTQAVPFGEPFPPSIKTYDLPMVSLKTRRPSRLTDEED